MKALLSAVGTRGDIQPVIAVALELRALGHEVQLCISPNFVEWAKQLGFTAAPVGIEMRMPRKGSPEASAPPKPIPDLIADQFASIGSVVKGCDIILGANAHQYAAPSLAELHGIPYVNALYSPTALPSEDNSRSWNERSIDRVNSNRAKLGLSPIEDVLSYIVTKDPWMATDPTLDTTPAMAITMVQTGAWMLADSTPLPDEVLRFLDRGDPPVYVGFGSMPAQDDTAQIAIGAARAAGKRIILSRGWAELEAIDAGADCLVIDDVNQQALFPRVAAVVHHGGAGTTHVAAKAAVPQVIVPMFGDQPYWAGRVVALGIGAAVPKPDLSTGRLASALADALAVSVAGSAQRVGRQILVDGAKRAAIGLAAQV